MIRLPRSLQGRLLVLVLGVVVGVWAATATLTWIDVRHELDELLDSHLAQAAALLVVQQAHDIEDDERRVDAPSLHRYAPKVAFQVFHEGVLALRSANAPATPMMATGENFNPGFRTLRIDDTTWRVFAARGGKRDIQVVVGEQVDSRAAIVWAVLRSMLWPMLVALPLLALAAWWAVHRGVAPLRRLGRTLAERRPQALEPVTVAGASSEMLPMLDALNNLFRRMSEVMESERRFTADAAHELRTPIAGIRAQAQVALAEADDAARRHALLATLEGCDRATRLVEQLLTLSRLEAGAVPATSSVDLSALVRRDVAELAARAIQQKRQVIEVDAPAPCALPGDSTLMSVLVRNLVDNAIRYSPADASIKVSVAQQGTHVRLKVEDSGPGMTEPDIGRVGERFFRVLGTGEVGSGLGWSIVQRIAAVHAATINVGRSADLGGLMVEVDWPAGKRPEVTSRDLSPG